MGRGRLGILAVVFHCLWFWPALAQQDQDAGRMKRFREAVLPQFKALIEAASQYADAQNHIRADAEERPLTRNALRQATSDFLRAATGCWPFELRRRPVSDAAKALRAADAFKREQYLKGLVGRDETAARYLAVADRFPQTPEHNRALIRCYKLYTKELIGGAKREPDKAKEILDRLRDHLREPRPVRDPAAKRVVAGGLVKHQSPATLALQAAQRFEEDRYLRGLAGREEAVAHYLAVADQHPGTPEHDRALWRGAHLYIQRLVGDAKVDIERAKKLFARLASRPGPVSSYMLLAEENLASFNSDPRARMRDRSHHYLRLAKRRDPVWLAKELLLPTPDTSPREFVRAVSEVMITLRAVQGTTARNMVADAVNSPDPVDALLWLKERHADDKLVQAEVTRALKYVSQTGKADGHVARIDSMAVTEMLAEANGREGVERTTSGQEEADASKQIEVAPPPATKQDARPQTRPEREHSPLWIFWSLLATATLIAVVIAWRRRTRA